MKALVKYAARPGNMEIRDVPEPAPGPGQVLVEVKEAGICGSDIHIYHSDIAIPLNPPVVTGHEFSGVVARNGEGCSKFEPGSQVVSETAFHYCGVCDFCREGFYNLCVERRTLGYWYNGVFTRHTVVPEARIHPIPDGVDFTSAAMTEPLACVVHAIYDLTRIVPGDVVLVSGPGAVGIMAAQVAKIHGATVVLSGTNVDAERLKLAESLGIDRTINAQTEDLNAFLASFTGGYGADVVLECSGSPRGVDAGLNVIKKRGWFTQIGLPGKKIEFDIEKVCYKELHFSGSLGSRNASWRKALQLLSEGKVNVRPLVTDKFSILEWERAFEKFEKKEGCKIFLLPAPD
jgi:L-iditol 2-dehydrogenase